MAPSPNQRPSIYNENATPIAQGYSTGVPSDTQYQPFKGFYVSGGGNVAIMGWDGNTAIFTSVANNIPIWCSGQRLMATGTGTTAASVILLQ